MTRLQSPTCAPTRINTWATIAKSSKFGNDIVERYRHTREVFIAFQTAQVLLNIAFAHNNLREYSTSITTAVEFLTRFERYADNAKSAPLFAQAMHIKASSHAALGETDVALGILDEIFERFGGQVRTGHVDSARSRSC